ncbi:hypothetical protein [Ruminococcus sp.]|uniref:hypothetical protein n=1 Tax=Ruminococcus sp. TaxID=41978 RepID=UPI003F0CB9C1
MKKLIISLLIISAVLLCGCNDSNNSINVEQPEKIATGDQIFSAKNENAVEESDNVNGMRFTLTLAEFTEKYNEIARRTDGILAINKEKWKVNGDVKTDTNGVEIRYYYYDETDTNFTATVEVQTGKILNIGCGTTMSNFVAQDENSSNSDKILKKSAIMAAAVCQFPTDSLDVLQDIFYRTTFDSSSSFWYQGFIFTLSTQENKSDSEKSVMLLRVFPVKDELKDEWKVTDYEAYAASVPVATE